MEEKQNRYNEKQNRFKLWVEKKSKIGKQKSKNLSRPTCHYLAAKQQCTSG